MGYSEISEWQDVRERSVPIWSNREQHGFTRVSLERYRISRHPRMTGTNTEQAGTIGKGQEKSRIVWKRWGYLGNLGDREQRG